MIEQKVALKPQKKQKPEIMQEVAIPENVQVSFSGALLAVKGQKGELKRELAYPGVILEKKGNKIIVKAPEGKKKRKAAIGSFVAHINNMFKGVTAGFKYKLKIVFSHFPVTAKVVGNALEVTNYLGEKSPRRADIVQGVKVTAGKDEITVEGIDVEKVGQTAANIELATRVTYRDPRVFQDGIYLVSRD